MTSTEEILEILDAEIDVASKRLVDLKRKRDVIVELINRDADFSASYKTTKVVEIKAIKGITIPVDWDGTQIKKVEVEA